MKTVTRFQCEFCGTEYPTEKEARSCEAIGFRPQLRPGDIVLARAGFGWFDGDKRWIENFDRVGPKNNPFDKPMGNESHGNCFGSCCTYRFYYVVTFVDADDARSFVDEVPSAHRPRYHLATLAMSDASGYGSGWTFDRHHCTPVKVENPPAYIAKTSKALIGRRAGSLL